MGPNCDPDNGGLTLPKGFCALVVADNLGAARHAWVAPNGDLFIALEKNQHSLIQKSWKRAEGLRRGRAIIKLLSRGLSRQPDLAVAANIQ